MRQIARLARLGTLAASILALVEMTGAKADDYPSQDIHLLCAYQAGSSSDAIVRFIGEKLKLASGRTVIVENKPGANANIATEYAVRAKPDGYTIFIHAGSALAANQHLLKSPLPDPTKSVQMIGTINRQAFILGVDAGKPWNTLADLTAAMKAKGAKASYASYSTSGTIMGELYKQATGIEATEVLYRIGANTLNDLKSGAIDYGMYDPAFALAQAREGRMKLLAIASNDRMVSSPDVPTFKEQGIEGIHLMGWFSAMVPAGTPKPIVDQLSNWLNEIVASEDTRKFLISMGSDPWVSSPEIAQKQLAQDIEEMGRLVKVAKIVPQ